MRALVPPVEAILQGATAPEAAGVIHSDFQKGFIKSESMGETAARSVAT